MDLAAFLIVAGPYSYFGCSDWEDVPTWPAVYDKPLGAPLGPAVQDATGTWKRAFVSGASCSINSGTVLVLGPAGPSTNTETRQH